MRSVLLVDPDPRTEAVLSARFRGAGLDLTRVDDAESALLRLAERAPDVLLTETRLGAIDGFELVRRLKGEAATRELPVIILSSERALEEKLRGLGLGAEDYLTKPIFVRELVTRIELLLARRARAGLDGPSAGTPARTHFRGDLRDMSVVDLLQAFEVGRKSCVLGVTSADGRGAAKVYVREGRVVDARLTPRALPASNVGDLEGEEAVYRTFLWQDGRFEVDFEPVDVPEAIATSAQGLLMEGLRRLDEWQRLCASLPNLDTCFVRDAGEIERRLRDVQPALAEFLALVDGQRSILDLVDLSPFDDLSTLTTLARLHGEGMLVVGPRSGASSLLPGTDSLLPGQLDPRSVASVLPAARFSSASEEPRPSGPFSGSDAMVLSPPSTSHEAAPPAKIDDETAAVGEADSSPPVTTRSSVEPAATPPGEFPVAPSRPPPAAARPSAEPPPSEPPSPPAVFEDEDDDPPALPTGSSRGLRIAAIVVAIASVVALLRLLGPGESTPPTPASASAPRRTVGPPPSTPPRFEPAIAGSAAPR